MPNFVRGIAMEGGIGPVAGSSHHSLYYRMPGIKIVSPMTPKEYKSIYNSFLKDDSVYYVSEHRGSYPNKNELPNILTNKPDLVIFAISITRFEASKAYEILKKQKIRISLINLLWIKPLKISDGIIKNLKSSKFGGLVLDDDYVDGISKSIANDLNLKSDKMIYTLGLKNKTAGTLKNLDNLPPNSKEIVRFVKKIIKDK